jgi:hypothetical protein
LVHVFSSFVLLSCCPRVLRVKNEPVSKRARG